MNNGPYTLVIAPANYPGKKYREKYCYEHHLVYWQNTGVTLKEGDVIHHRNGNKTDNSFANLELESRADHTIHHNIARGKPLITIKCAYCGSDKIIEFRNYRFQVKNGQTKFYCSRSCGVKQQHVDQKNNPIATNPRHQNRVRGVQHHSSKLDPDKIKQIRQLKQQGMFIKQLARMFSVTPKAIRDIIKGVTWTSIQA